MRRNGTQTDVGQTTVFLLSDYSSAITGEVVHVDSGYHVMGLFGFDGAAEAGEK